MITVETSSVFVKKIKGFYKNVLSANKKHEKSETMPENS